MLIGSGTTADAYTDFSVYPRGRKMNLAIKNTHGANTASIKVSGYVTESDAESFVELLAEEDLLAEAVKNVEVTKVFEQVTMSIKTKTSPDHVTYEVHASISLL